MPYTGRAARTGNSKGFRFEGALFTAHPEFASGEIEADVIAPGRLLVRAVEPGSREERSDPIMEAFLAFLADQMQRHPERIEPFARAGIAGLDDLLAGVEYDPAEHLDDEFELP